MLSRSAKRAEPSPRGRLTPDRPAEREQYIRRSGREPAGPRRSPGSRGHRLPRQEPPPAPAAPQPLQAGRHVPHHERHPLHVGRLLLVGAHLAPVRAGGRPPPPPSPPPPPPPAAAPGAGGGTLGAPDAGAGVGRHGGPRRRRRLLCAGPRSAHGGDGPHAPRGAGHGPRARAAGPHGLRERRGRRPARPGGVRRALQAAPHQAGGDPGRRGLGAGQPEDPGRGLAQPEHHLPLRVADAVAQQHDRPQAHPAGLAGGGREVAPREAGQARALQRRREEAQADLHRRPREALARGLLRAAAAAVLREDRRHRREARPQEERGARLVLQPAPEAEAHEVLRGHLSAARRCGSAGRREEERGRRPPGRSRRYRGFASGRGLPAGAARDVSKVFSFR
ncbi:POU domain, class 4, transcription factor 2 isoform X2 [Excalfactoria chinensis]|uniref:POU domain, class 4, transcription factor 2 isoform X2 n=1 Tax=Excalfactoria chinensis TaxID=46218 RepID=UPI003B39FBA5